MVGDNIKELRAMLGLTQQKFAARLGVKQATLSMVESGKSNASQQLLMAISREFGVRIEWLETGEGEKFNEKNMTIIEQLAAEFHLDAKSREFLENFLRLTPDNRKRVVAGIETAAILFPRKPDNELTKDEVLEIVGYEWDKKTDAEKRGTSTSSASTGLSGTSKKIGTSP